MVRSGKERSCRCSKLSNEISGDPDRVSDRLNPHDKEIVSDNQSQLVAKVAAKSKLEATTGGRKKGEGGNKKNIGGLMPVLLIKVGLLKLKYVKNIFFQIYK